MVGWPGLRAPSTGGKLIGAAELIFKKAFGIDVGPVEPFTWLLEMRDAVFSVEAAGLTWSVSSGRVGIDDKEKLAIGLFKHSDERDPRFITEIPTLNLTAPVDIEGAKDLDDRRIGVADGLVEPFVRRAFVALQRFIEAYRDVKYLQGRGTENWLEQRGVFVREMPLTTFRSYLFYRLTAGDRVFVGVFSEGRMISAMPGDTALREAVTAALAQRVPLARVLMVRAWEGFFEGDFRSAIVDAATVIELSLAQLLRRKLLAAGPASKRRIDRLIKETSNRLLVTVVGGLLGIEAEAWREGVAAAIETRHGVVHGGKRYASEADARSAIAHAERLLILAEETPPAASGPAATESDEADGASAGP